MNLNPYWGIYVLDTNTAKQYWEGKILAWEEARYAARSAMNPLAWTVRNRLSHAEKIILDRTQPGVAILELGCGSGVLAERLAGHCGNYIGVDIAENAITRAAARGLPAHFRFVAEDLTKMPLPWSDLTVFLGVTDWVDSDLLCELFEKLKTKNLLFSYTQEYPWSPYRIYRKLVDGASGGKQHARTYSQQQIEALLSATNFTMEIVVKPAPHNPGGLIWAQRV